MFWAWGAISIFNSYQGGAYNKHVAAGTPCERLTNRLWPQIYADIRRSAFTCEDPRLKFVFDGFDISLNATLHSRDNRLQLFEASENVLRRGI